MGSSSSTPVSDAAGGTGTVPQLFRSDKELREHIAAGSLSQHKLDLKIPDGISEAAIIVACGSFSPPTVAHFRILEDARDSLRAQGIHVLGGFMSPVHAAYGKKSLVEMYHRVNMMSIALADSDWISVDMYECVQDEWTRTALVMDRFQEELDRLHQEGSLRCRAKALLLGGADLVESFKAINPDGERVWSLEDVEKIVTKGMACITRQGVDLQAVVEGMPLLEENKDNLKVVHPIGGEGISSTLVRKLLSKGSSIKYLVHDGVVEYIRDNRLAEKKQWQP